jgi:serine/threonine protein kinase
MCLFREAISDEILFMKRLNYHKHLVNMLGCISDVTNPLIILELCSNGNLLNFLRQEKEKSIKVRKSKAIPC